MMSEEESNEEYDPATCITAGELRGYGIHIDSGIPNCAWVKRSSVENTRSEVTIDGVLTINVKFNEPFKWYEMDWEG